MHNKNQMPPVTFFNKVRIVSLAQDGKSSTQIAATLGIPRTTINPIIKKWRQDRTVERRPGSGGHRVSTCEEDEQLTAVIENSPSTTAVDAVGVTHFRGSISTARRRIKAAGLQNHVAARKIKLTPQHKETRMGYALEYLTRDEAFWNRVVFSDEKVFQSCRNGRIKVYRPRNTCYNEGYVETTDEADVFDKFVGMDFCSYSWSNAMC
jgi:transposase